MGLNQRGRWGYMKNENNNPMRRRLCGAKTRKGKLCRGLAMNNGRCRMHGGNSPGAPKGNQNAFKHGLYSKAMREELESYRELLNIME